MCHLIYPGEQARILEAIFEADFCDFSYGFRPGRNPHHALQALRLQIVTKKVSHVYEADIRGYFTHVNHSWLWRMLAHRVADPVILGLVGKWLKAGAIHDGEIIRTEEGTPQGGPISCVLANIYLHFTLDLWVCENIRQGAGAKRTWYASETCGLSPSLAWHTPVTGGRRATNEMRAASLTPSRAKMRRPRVDGLLRSRPAGLAYETASRTTGRTRQDGSRGNRESRSKPPEFL